MLFRVLGGLPALLEAATLHARGGTLETGLGGPLAAHGEHVLQQMVSLLPFRDLLGPTRSFHRVKTPKRRPSSLLSGKAAQQPPLNAAIYQASDWQQIQQLLEARGPHFREANITAALFNLACIERTRPAPAPSPPSAAGTEAAQAAAAQQADGSAAVHHAVRVRTAGASTDVEPEGGSSSSGGGRGMVAGAREGFVLDPGQQEVVDRLLGMARAKLSGFDSQSLALLTWSCATLNYCPPALLPDLAAVAQQKVEMMQPRQLANTLWALAKLWRTDTGGAGGVNMPQRAQTFVDQFAERLDVSNLQDVSNMLYAMARLRHYPGDAVLGRFARCVEERLQHAVTAQTVANCVWAFGQLGYSDTALVQALARVAAQHASSFGAEELLAILTGLASLRNLPAGVVEEYVPQLFTALNPLLTLESPLLPHAYPLASLFAAQSGTQQPLLQPPELHQAAQEQWQAWQQQALQQMAAQPILAEVSAALQRLSTPHHAATWLDSVPAMADVLLLLTRPAGHADVAVLLLHPDESVAHNDPTRPLGNALMREQLLRAHGYHVIRITETQWRDWGGLAADKTWGSRDSAAARRDANLHMLLQGELDAH